MAKNINRLFIEDETQMPNKRAVIFNLISIVIKFASLRCKYDNTGKIFKWGGAEILVNIWRNKFVHPHWKTNFH